MRKVNFYIDGYNLYYALKERGLYHLLWLDLERFCSSFLVKETQIVNRIDFFTAVWRRKPDSEKRQTLYIKALQAKCGDLIKIIRGKFDDREFRCEKCNTQLVVQKEKWTDINIAIAMIIDALEDEYDIAYLISADSDYTPLVRILKNRFEKDVRVIFPPGLFSDDLHKVASMSQSVDPGLLSATQLPDVVTSSEGKTYKKPAKWQQNAMF